MFREDTNSVAELLQVIKAQTELWALAGAKDLRSLASGVAHYPLSCSFFQLFHRGHEPGFCAKLYFLLNTMMRNSLTHSRKKKSCTAASKHGTVVPDVPMKTYAGHRMWLPGVGA